MQSIRNLATSLLARLFPLAAIIILAGGAWNCFADSGYNFKTIDPPGARNQANGNGINNSGQIVGSYADGASGHGFLLDTDFSNIDYPGASYTDAYGINNAGQIVGGYDGAHGFLLEGSTFRVLDYPSGTQTQARGINDFGQIVGTYYSAGYHGFRLVGSTFTSITYPGALDTYAYGINNTGDVVGTYSDSLGNHGFLLRGGVFTPINCPSGIATFVDGINNHGQMAGMCQETSAVHGFLLSGGVFYNLDFPGSNSTWSVGINDAAQMVGFYRKPGEVHAFLGKPGYRGVPSMMQSRFGNQGDFELVVPLVSGGIAHLRRDNDDPSQSWRGPIVFGVSLGLVDAVTMIQSNISSSGGPGNLEVIARVGDRLEAFWREDVPPFNWSGPIAVPGAKGVTGNPVLIQSQFGIRGDFEVIVPLTSGGIAHFTRFNDQASTDYRLNQIFARRLGPVDAVTLIQSNYSSSGGGPGNLEVIARPRGSSSLYYFTRDDADPFQWSEDPVFVSGNVQGNPVLIQSRFGVQGDFTLVAPSASPTGGLTYGNRYNDMPGQPWSAPFQGWAAEIGAVTSVAFIESNYTFSAGPGNFDVIALSGNSLFSYWRDDFPPYSWHPGNNPPIF